MRPFHRPRPISAGRVVAHRGFSQAAPENTLAAFERAAELGAAIELDAALTATGEVVCLHDARLERTTNGTGLVEETPFSEVQNLDAGGWFDPRFKGEPIPTLKDVLDAVAGRVMIDIELKPTRRKSALVNAVIDAVRHASVERIFVSSFDPFLLMEVRRREPAIRRAQLVGSFVGVPLVWPQRVLLQKLVFNPWTQPDAIIGGDDFVTARWVERQKRRGYTVMVYTVNDPERMVELDSWGVDAIITDRPDMALQTV
ncbi:MAG: glycerophosphodiester phosphodiesterase family protein [Myxococcota bacterium]